MNKRTRFRIKWLDVFAVLGASALFVWFILHMLIQWGG